jgi:hypothetical protein
VALCGKGLFGCVGIPSTGRRCDANKVVLGSFEDIATPYQTWNYDRGLLKSNVPPPPPSTTIMDILSNGGGEKKELCLSVPMKTSSSWSSSNSRSKSASFQEGTTYKVALEDCEASNMKQRWLFGSDDAGRIHNLDDTRFCLTIQAPTYAALQAQGSDMVLEECYTDALADTKQALIVKGNGLEAFLYASQKEYGVYDTIRLAFLTLVPEEGEDDEMNDRTEIHIFALDTDGMDSMEWATKNDDEASLLLASPTLLAADALPALSKTTCVHSDVWNVDAAELVVASSSSNTSNGDVQYFVAQLGSDTSTRIAFSIHSQQGCGWRSSGSVAGTALLVSLLGLVVAVLGVVCVHRYTTGTRAQDHQAEQASGAVSSSFKTKQDSTDTDEDEDDETTQASDEDGRVL